MNSYTHRDDCRLCASTNLDLVLPILPSAIGDEFVSAEKLNEQQEIFPLDTYLCLDCGHLQNLDVVNPEILFRNYTYCTSVSLGLVEHFRKYAADVKNTLNLKENSLVVEIGSNDGSLLKAFKNLGMHVQGVDPARNIAAKATQDGIPTLPEFFTADIAGNILEKNGKASLVCANNVFAHANHIADIVKGIRTLLTDDGVFVFEVSYVPDIIDNFVFDTIYHEHVSHHALIPLEKFFNRFDMTLFDVQRVSTKGGSIRGFAQVISTGKRPKSEQLISMMQKEEERGILKPEIYRNFFAAIEQRKQAVIAYLDKEIAAGKTVCGYGASTTTTTLMYHFELGQRLKFIVDDNPGKHNMYSPGWHLPVYPSAKLYETKPDVVVILAWIYADKIIEKNAQFIQQGGTFIVPLPEVKIINKSKITEKLIA